MVLGLMVKGNQQQRGRIPGQARARSYHPVLVQLGYGALERAVAVWRRPAVSAMAFGRRTLGDTNLQQQAIWLWGHIPHPSHSLLPTSYGPNSNVRQRGRKLVCCSPQRSAFWSTDQSGEGCGIQIWRVQWGLSSTIANI